MQECSLDSVENISEACNDAFFTIGTSQNKIQLNPGDPLGSLTSGSQQFTIIADTEHGGTAASHLAVGSVLTMADAGVKHIMLEMHSDPDTQGLLDRLYQNPPEVTEQEFFDSVHLFEAVGFDEDKTFEDSVNYAQMIWSARQEGIQMHLANDQAGYAQSDQLKEIEQQQQNLRDQNPSFDEHLSLSDESYNLYEQRESLLNQNFEARLVVKTAENMGLTAIPDAEYESLSDEAKEIIRQVEQIDAQGWETYEAMESLKQSNPEIIGLEQQYNALAEEWLEISNESFEQRISVESEEARADKFIDLANGEKSVIIFGAGHMDKSYDLNEAIDERLKQDAFQNGASEHFVETQVIAAYESQQDYRDKSNLRGEQSADVLYVADEDKIYITDVGRDNLELGIPLPQASEPAQQLDSGIGQ